MSKGNYRHLVAMLGGMALAFGLVGCGGSGSSSSATSAADSSAASTATGATSAADSSAASTASSSSEATSSSSSASSVVEVPDDSTDQMWQDTIDGARFYVFAYEGEAFMADVHGYGVNVSYGEPLKDGFYQVVADVTYLNGGIAGYVDYPEVKSVASVQPVSPFDMGLPATKDEVYGVTLIGDYADGDVLVYGGGPKLVWKDGAWAYHYDNTVNLSDGRSALVRSGVTADEVQAGADEGVLSNENYFVLPQKQ